MLFFFCRCGGPLDKICRNSSTSVDRAAYEDDEIVRFGQMHGHGRMFDFYSKERINGGKSFAEI